jgi:hypothetical protein
MADATAATELPTRLFGALEKYRLIVALKRSGPDITPPPPAGSTDASRYWSERRQAMRELAARFPGALREWDALSRETLEERLRQVEALRAAPGALDDLPPWLAATLELHDTLRELLRVRRAWTERARSGSSASPDGKGRPSGEIEAFRDWYVTIFQPCWTATYLTDERIRAILTPPGGRLSEVAYVFAAERCGTSVAAVKASLYHEPPPP